MVYLCRLVRFMGQQSPINGTISMICVGWLSACSPGAFSFVGGLRGCPAALRPGAFSRGSPCAPFPCCPSQWASAAAARVRRPCPSSGLCPACRKLRPGAVKREMSSRPATILPEPGKWYQNNIRKVLTMGLKCGTIIVPKGKGNQP
jgi:hypothetical protein